MSEAKRPKPVMMIDEWGPTTEQTQTSCKHRDGSCERCGTSDRRDAKHRTRSGRGVVAENLRKP